VSFVIIVRDERHWPETDIRASGAKWYLGTHGRSVEGAATCYDLVARRESRATKDAVGGTS
jgi:hypothetical protein